VVVFLQLQIKMVNINSSDIVDGKSTVILGLIWTLILNFEVRKFLHYCLRINDIAYYCYYYYTVSWNLGKVGT